MKPKKLFSAVAAAVMAISLLPLSVFAEGTSAANHNERFDVDEDALPVGAACYATYALEFLKTDFATTHNPKYKYSECLKMLGKEDDLKLLY